MIYDKLENIGRYQNEHSHLCVALNYLMEADFSQLKKGRNEISGEDVFLIVQDNELSEDNAEVFEVHQTYADIHVVVEGEEEMTYGYGLEIAIKSYDATNDFSLVSCSNKTPFILSPGYFILFFPNEAHLPGKSTSDSKRVKKYVVKVAI